MLNTKYGRIRKAIEILLEHIDKRFELTEIMIAAAILDPSVQHLNAIDDWISKKKSSKAQVLRNIITDFGIVIDSGPDERNRSPHVVVNTQIHKENDVRISLLKKTCQSLPTK